MTTQQLPNEEVLLVDFCDETCPEYEHEHEICEDIHCPYQRPSNGIDYTHLHESHPPGQPPRSKLKNNLNNHSFIQQPLDMGTINQHSSRSWSATARSPPSYDHHDGHHHGSKAHHSYNRHHKSSIHHHPERSVSAMTTSYSFDGLSQHCQAHSDIEYSSTSCSTPRYDVHYDASTAVVPLGPPVGHGSSMGSPQPPPVYYRTPESQRSPVLSMRSSVSSRSSDVSLSTMGSQSPATSSKSSMPTLQMPSIMYSQPIEPPPPHQVRSISQPVPVYIVSDSHHPAHPQMLPYDDCNTPVPAILPPTMYQSRPKPLIVHTGLTSPALIPIQAVPAVEISSSPLNIATPSSASLKKRRRDTAYVTASPSVLAIPRGAVTDTHSYIGNKHFMFGSPPPSSGHGSAVSFQLHGQRRHSTVSAASYPGDESPVVPVLLLPRSAVSMQRDASVPLPGRRSSVSYHKPLDPPTKRRKSIVDPNAMARSPLLTSPMIDNSLLQMVKLHDPFRAMVVACVQYLHTSSNSQTSEPLHMKARTFLHSRFHETSASPWVEPVITHALWIHERGWSDYSQSCPPDIHLPSAVHLPSPSASPLVTHSDNVIPRFSALVLDHSC